MRFFIFSMFCSFLVYACNNVPSSENEEAPKPSLSDSLLKLVIDGHDVAMPKMFKLERLITQAKTEKDSLKKLGGNNARKALLDGTLTSLEQANASMQRWMEGFKYDSLKNNEPARIEYLKAQLESVNKMKEEVLSSLAKADTVFKRSLL